VAKISQKKKLCNFDHRRVSVTELFLPILGGGITPVQFCKSESALLNPGYGISLLYFGLAAESIYTQAQNRM
jgi:hypothetical protein